MPTSTCVIVAEKLGGENEYGETDELDFFIAEHDEIVAVIFDPAGSFLAGGTDAHRSQNRRSYRG